MERINIRPVEEKDVSRISEIVRGAGNFNEIEIATAVELVQQSISKQEDYIVQVLEDEENIVRAYVCYGPIPLTENTYDLYWIAVEPCSQKKGYGQALMRFAEEDLRKRSARLLVIETSSKENYGGTVRFYEKMGYHLVSRLKEFYRRGDDKLTFAKWFIFIALFSVLILSGCKKENKEKLLPASTPESLADNELVLVTTNDFHAQLQRAEGLASVIRGLRKKYGDHMVYLDAGDQFQGSLEGNMNKGQAVVDFFNLLGPDAAALGNHELDYGPDVPRRITVDPGEDGMGNIKARMLHAKYKFLSSNLIVNPPVPCKPGPLCNALGQTTVLEPRRVFERNKQTVCVVGATTTATAYITNPDFLKGVMFEDMAPVLRAEIKYLRESNRCDWMILDVHEGFRYEADHKTFKSTGLLPIMKTLDPNSVDAVVGGHSHIRVQEAVNGIPVIQTGIGGEVVGVIHLFHESGKRTYRFEPFVPVPDTAVAFDITSALSIYRQKAFQYKRQVVGKAMAPFPQDKINESALGNLMADAVLEEGRKHGHVDFALMNAGGIRGALPPGKITLDHVFRLMPFDDTLVVVEIKGSELLTLLQIAFSGAMGLPPVSGLNVTCRRVNSGQPGPWQRDLNEDGKAEDWERNLIIDVRDRNGKPIDPNKTYHLATNNFLTDGGDFQDLVYDGIPQSRIHIFPDLIRDILGEYIQAKSPLRPARYYSSNQTRVKVVTNESTNIATANRS